MAECAASASFIKLHLRGAGIGERGFLNNKLYFRKLFHQNAEAVSFVNCKSHELYATLKSNRHQTTSFTCPCLGSLVSVNATTASEWIPVADQVLLLASMLLTHMAGVTTVRKPSDMSAKTNMGVGMISGGSTFSGSTTSNDGDPVLVWNVMKQKLSDSLEVANETTSSRDGVLEFAKGPLSLNALAEGPRLRLLLAVVINLEKEVGAIPESLEAVDDWKTIFFGIIKKSLKPICMDWLEKEFLKENNVSNEVLISYIMNKLKGDDSILQNIRKSGKEDLYADLFLYLGRGSLRGGFYYDNSLFVSQGTFVLEDLVIAVADGIASIYLELISVDGNVSNEMNTLASTLCSLSTRSLQRLRNEVALKQWLHQNMEAVASMYEDRFDLRVLQVQTRTIEEPSKCPMEGFSWWEQIFAKKSSEASAQLQYVVIGSFSMAVKRTKELRALSGWRYYFSLYLELSDITMPLIRTVIDKVSNAISFFLVCLIGRSLGLIYTGIRQSLRWK